jgi:hypothetical protein
MLSTLLELLGLVALIAGVFALAGLGYALLAAAPALFFLALAADGVDVRRFAVRRGR